MADDGDTLANAVKEAIDNGDGEAAASILEEADLSQIKRADCDKLAALAISDAYIAGFYLRAVGFLSPQMQAKFTQDLGTHARFEELFEILQKPEAAPHRDTAVSAAIKRAEEDIGVLYAFASGHVSKPIQAQLNTALGLSRAISNEHLAKLLASTDMTQHRDAVMAGILSWMSYKDIAAFLNEAGHFLPDDMVLRFARAMQQ